MSVLIALMTTGLFASSFSELRIAVLDFAAPDLDSSEAAMISEKFRVVLRTDSVLNVMEREALYGMLRTKGYPGAGTCGATDCMMETGQFLEATSVVAGQVTRANGVTAVSIRGIDVGTGVVLLERTGEFDDDFKKLLSTHIPAEAQECARVLHRRIRSFTARFGQGLVSVQSFPVNGRIEVDGVKTGLTTPVVIRAVEAGIHRVRVHSYAFEGDTTVEVIAGTLTRCHVPLRRGRGRIKLVSPRGMGPARITVDGLGSFDAPKLLDSIPAGTYTVACSLAGYFPYQDSFRVHAGRTTELLPLLRPASYLRIDEIAADAVLKVDSERVGDTGTAVVRVEPGVHTIHTERPGFAAFSTEINTTAGDTAGVSLAYRPRTARLRLFSSPTGAMIRFGGKVTGMTPARFTSLEPGAYEISLAHTKHLPETFGLELDPGADTSVHIRFGDLSDEYTQWEHRKRTAKVAGLGVAGLGPLMLEGNAWSVALLSAGIASDVALGVNIAGAIRNDREVGQSTTRERGAFFLEKRQRNTRWIIVTATTSALFRAVGYLVTSRKEFR